MAATALSARSLSKRFELYDRPVDRLKQTLFRGRRRFYREFWALRDVSFSLAPGQALGVIGRNGSGKSTLLQLIAGTLTPTMGDIQTQGRVSALLELGSGFNPEFTGRENVFLNGAILGLPRDAVRELMPGLLAFADIGEFIDRPVKMYSSGMALRLAFAVATAVAPKILIVDEALAVGDEAFQRKCFARIEQIREDGAAILFVSHSPAQILELCDAALLLDAGEALLLDEPRRVVPEYQRILYASPDAAARLRERLRAGVPPREEAIVEPDIGEARESVEALPETRLRNPDFATATVADGQRTRGLGRGAPMLFDPDLRSASVVEYPSHGARIRNPRITTLSGEPANLLVRGERYWFAYDVEFAQPVQRVRLGMMIKTTSGVELGGAVHAVEDAATAHAGARVAARFEFHADLFPGMYFLNAGAMGQRGETETYLHRLVDAVAFRVQHDATQMQSGYVDFRVRAESMVPPGRNDG